MMEMLRRRLNYGDDTTESMSMTFDGWNTYKTKLLFDGWAVETKWEFALSCVAVVFFAVMYQAMRFLVYVVEDTMHPQADPSFSTLVESSLEGAGGGRMGRASDGGGYQLAGIDAENPLTNTGASSATKRPVAAADELSSTRYIWLRLLHSLLSGLNYGLALLLMLLAMTYNPSIFISLISGYALGDFIFFARMRPSSESCH